jgi:hypothetical protein
LVKPKEIMRSFLLDGFIIADSWIGLQHRDQ